MKLIDFKKNIFSQHGEDGIIEKIFEVIKPISKVSVEFGAWDGLKYANTANLWKNKRWYGVLIESDDRKIKELFNNTLKYDCTIIHESIDSKINTLDKVLKKNGMYWDIIDFLSIDIDGDDYYIMSTLKLKPRVIACEYNPTIPYWLDVHAIPGSKLGASVSALARVAVGYKLIAVTLTNCFFVLESEYHKFKEFDTGLHDIANKDGLNYLVTAYNGKYFIYGKLLYGMEAGINGRLPQDCVIKFGEGK